MTPDKQPHPSDSSPSAAPSDGPTAQARARANIGGKKKKPASKKPGKPAGQPSGKKAGKPASQPADGQDAQRAGLTLGSEPQPFKGKLINQPEHSPAKMQAQYIAYEMYTTQRASYNKIAEKLGINRKTVPAYIAAESERRAEDWSDMRQAVLARRIHNIEEVEVFYFEKMHSPQAKGDEGRTILEAQKALAALMGLDSAIVVKHETEARNPFAEIATAAEALAILQSIPDGNVPRS